MTADGQDPLALAKGFVRAPRLVIFDTTLDPSARLTYLAVASFAIHGEEAWPSMGQSLGVDMSQRRQEWAAWDLQTPDGVKVEVKCGAYIPGMAAPEKPSQVRYSGLLVSFLLRGHRRVLHGRA